MEHKNEIAIKVLRDEYADYDDNSWHYDREYKMLVEAQNLALSKESDARTSHDKALHKHIVTKRFELDFNGHLKTLVEINDNEPNILAAMNGYGDSVDTNKCIVTKK